MPAPVCYSLAPPLRSSMPNWCLYILHPLDEHMPNTQLEIITERH